MTTKSPMELEDLLNWRYRCQECGQRDATLRYCGFRVTYVFTQAQRYGTRCAPCQRRMRWKYGALSILCGLWAIPRGTISALHSILFNLTEGGGDFPVNENVELLNGLAPRLVAGGRIEEAIRAYEASLELIPDERIATELAEVRTLATPKPGF